MIPLLGFYEHGCRRRAIHCGSRICSKWPFQPARPSAVSQQVSLVWTGPQLAGRTLRRTEQGLLEVIQTARNELWIVTFAAYRVGSIVQALHAALERGVRVWLVAESADASDGKLTFDAASALGREVLSRNRSYLATGPATSSNGAADRQPSRQMCHGR